MEFFKLRNTKTKHAIHKLRTAARNTRYYRGLLGGLRIIRIVRTGNARSFISRIFIKCKHMFCSTYERT